MLTNPTLHDAIIAYEIGPVGAPTRFSERLARKMGWSLETAEAVETEYRRYAYLNTICDEPLTPSVAVDEAWHQHILHTREYFERFCPEVLGGVMHHEPGVGADGEAGAYLAQYARTLTLYEREFGAPPEGIWPAIAADGDSSATTCAGDVGAAATFSANSATCSAAIETSGTVFVGRAVSIGAGAALTSSGGDGGIGECTSALDVRASASGGGGEAGATCSANVRRGWDAGAAGDVVQAHGDCKISAPAKCG